MNWRLGSTTIGNLAQWVSAVASLGTIGLAFYGLSKAVPYFENLNLRETNARLQLSNRALEDTKTDIERQLATAREQTNETRLWLRHSTILMNCFALQPRMYDVVQGAYAKAFNALSFHDVDAQKLPSDLGLIGPRVKLRAVLDVMVDDSETHWPSEDYARAKAAWKATADKYGDKLDDVLLFPGMESNTRRPPKAALEQAVKNNEIGNKLRDDLFAACLDLRLFNKEKPDSK